MPVASDYSVLVSSLLVLHVVNIIIIIIIEITNQTMCMHTDLQNI